MRAAAITTIGIQEVMAALAIMVLDITAAATSRFE